MQAGLESEQRAKAEAEAEARTGRQSVLTRRSRGRGRRLLRRRSSPTAVPTLLPEREKEARSLLDSAKRGKRQTEAELAESRAVVNEMTSINSRAASDKRAVESAVHTIRRDR